MSLEITDQSGDAKFDFIDIKKGSVEIQEKEVKVILDLVNLPEQLTFQHDDLETDRLEYEWAAYFDLDAESSTGSPGHRGAEYSLSATYFKSEMEGSEHEGKLLDNVQINSWEYDGDSWPAKSWDASGEANFTENRLILTFNIDRTIPEGSIIFFRAAHDNGVEQDTDTTSSKEL